MISVAITGSIGMGKSTVARMFADLGAVVWDADEAVHRLYAPGGAALDAIEKRFQGVVTDAGVDRPMLAACVLDDPEAMADLEAIVHPLVALDRRAAFDAAASTGAEVFLVDIPLLFETGAAPFFNYVIVVSAPEPVQRARVLQRAGMTEEKLDAILARQISDAEKRARADFVIDTGGTLSNTRRQAEQVWRQLTTDRPGAGVSQR